MLSGTARVSRFATARVENVVDRVLRLAARPRLRRFRPERFLWQAHVGLAA